MTLAQADFIRLCRVCDANPEGLRVRLLRALAIIRPGNRYEPIA